MKAIKTRISATVSPQLAKALTDVATKGPHSKSSLIEMALKKIFEEQLAKDAETISKVKIKDLPTEDEWLKIYPDVEY